MNWREEQVQMMGEGVRMGFMEQTPLHREHVQKQLAYARGQYLALVAESKVANA